ncbi:hypothetical protein GCM10010360_55710 [Streptomyces nogalater]
MTFGPVDRRADGVKLALRMDRECGGRAKNGRPGPVLRAGAERVSTVAGPPGDDG